MATPGDVQVTEGQADLMWRSTLMQHASPPVRRRTASVPGPVDVYEFLALPAWSVPVLGALVDAAPRPCADNAAAGTGSPAGRPSSASSSGTSVTAPRP
ncbi:hypothetical protein, partial [Candidatus Frankia nodulisporulans]|uniref:hypothetical protein n=1 Tax=Candidatus Frankia nodulisporulans TaxID=2060052 RepID=UPI001CDD0DC0